MKRHLELIGGTLQVLEKPELMAAFNTALSGMEEHGWTQLVAAIRKVLSGERDADVLCEPLDSEDSMIIETLLRALEDPSSLAALLPQPKPED